MVGTSIQHLLGCQHRLLSVTGPHLSRGTAVWETLYVEGDLSPWGEQIWQRCIHLAGREPDRDSAPMGAFQILSLRYGSGSSGRAGNAFSGLWPQRGMKSLRSRKATLVRKASCQALTRWHPSGHAYHPSCPVSPCIDQKNPASLTELAGILDQESTAPVWQGELSPMAWSPSDPLETGGRRKGELIGHLTQEKSRASSVGMA